LFGFEPELWRLASEALLRLPPWLKFREFFALANKLLALPLTPLLLLFLSVDPPVSCLVGRPPLPLRFSPPLAGSVGFAKEEALVGEVLSPTEEVEFTVGSGEGCLLSDLVLAVSLFPTDDEEPPPNILFSKPPPGEEEMLRRLLPASLEKGR